MEWARPPREKLSRGEGSPVASPPSEARWRGRKRPVMGRVPPRGKSNLGESGVVGARERSVLGME